MDTKKENFLLWEEVMGDDDDEDTFIDKIKDAYFHVIWWFQIQPVNWRKLLCKLFWPHCDICGKPAYFEHYPSIGDYQCPNCPDKDDENGIWFYVCWNCSMKHEGHGMVE